MPKLYEVNTENEVLCYLPSGKVTDKGQKTQLMQDGDTCWFFSTKRLANATGVQIVDSTAKEKYRLISNFRKTQSRLDSAVLIAATLLAKNYSTNKIHGAAIGALLAQRGVTNAYRFSPSLIQKIISRTSPEGQALPRQLKDLKKDAKIIQEYVERYKKLNPEPIISYNSKTIESIVLWLKARNPYQSQLLECACDTADSLSRLSSVEFSGQHQYWAARPRQLVVKETSTPLSADPFAKIFSPAKPSVIILGAGPSSTMGSTATPELTVAEKQERRKLALADFNQKINKETFNVFGMQTTTFTTPEGLRDRLKEHGPVIMSGYYGKSFYTAPYHILKDQHGHIQTLGTRQLIGWKQTEAKGTDSFNPLLEHQIIIIGIKFDTDTPNRSQVIFIDPSDSSFPGEQRKAYSISFERLSRNRSTIYRDQVTAHYSTSERHHEMLFDKEMKVVPTSMVRRLLTFGMVAAVATGATYAVYNKMSLKV